jgi:hypothetical protein
LELSLNGGEFYALASEYRPRIVDFFQRLSSVANEDSLFLHSDVPFDFAEKSGKTVFIVRGAALSMEYNTRWLGTGGRATRVVESAIVPSVQAFVRSFEHAPIDFFAMVVFYGSKEFGSSGTSQQFEPEAVAAVFPASACEKFVRGEITASQLCAGADFYVAERNMPIGSGMRKIDLHDVD